MKYNVVQPSTPTPPALPDKNQRLVSILMIVMFISWATINVLAFYYQIFPVAYVIPLLLIGSAAGWVLTRRGKADTGIWANLILTWVVLTIITIGDPQSPMEPTPLVARYIFPVVLYAAIGWVGLSSAKKKRTYIGALVAVSIGFAMLGHALDPEISDVAPVYSNILYVVVALSVAAALALIYRTIPEALKRFRQSIRLRLTMGFGVVALVTVAFALVAFNIISAVASAVDARGAADEETTQAQSLSSQLNGARFHEQEFLNSYPVVGVDSAVETIVPAQQEQVTAALTTINQLEAGVSPDVEHLHSDEQVEEIHQAVLAYDQSFDELVTLVQIRGFQDTGLEGEFREAVHTLEDSEEFSQNPELLVTLLQMRRHEKDWFLRHETEDAETVRSYTAVLENQIRGLDISASRKTTLLGLASDYLTKFNQVVDYDVQISEKLADMAALTAPIEPLVTEFIARSQADARLAQDELNATEVSTRNVAIGFGFVALAVSIAVSTLTSRSISNPVLALTQAAGQLAKGDRESRAQVLTDDELGELATTFNSMADELNHVLDNLEHTVEQRTTDLVERAKELEASQRVTFAASEQVSPNELLNLVVNLIRDQFNLYHAQVYILNETKDVAVLRESTGYAGRTLLNRKHSIPMERTSLVTKSIKTKDAVLVSETRKDPNWLPNDLLPDTQSELVVPLLVDGEVIGALDIQSRDAGYFTDRSVPLFQQMTNQVAFLFENSDLIARVTKQSEQMAGFTDQLRSAAELAAVLNTITDPETLLEEAVNQMQNRFGFYHTHIYLLDEAGMKLNVAAASGDVGRKLVRNQHSIDASNPRSLVATAARTQEVVVAADVTLAEGFLANPLLPNTRSEVSFPLLVGEKVLGVLDVQDDEINRFSQADVDTLSTLAGQVASSLESARQYQEAQNEKARFQTLIENAPEAVVVFDGETGFFTDANQNAATLYGYATAKEVIGKHPALDHSPEFQPDGRRSTDAAGGYIMEAINGGSPVFEWVHKNAQGAEIPCEVRLVRLPGTDKPVLRGSITNIIDRKAARDAIVQSDKLKSEFLANMSHELRTPLNSIVGYTDVLLMGIDGELNDEMELDVQAIQENSRTLLRIINDILDLAKIEAGRAVLELSQVEVKDLLGEVVRKNAGLLVNKPVEMEVEAADGLPLIPVDAGRVSQVMNNLVSNAVKFTEEGKITLKAFTERDMMVLQVTDTGAGIEDKYLSMIFEEFRQADGSQTRTAEGTGLGLTITRRLVHMHGGSIDVQSAVGEGSTFTVRLPLTLRIPSDVTIRWVETVAEPKAIDTKPLALAGEPAANGKAPKTNGRKK